MTTNHVSWRDKARPIIARVLIETKGKTEPVIRQALLAAYPFGERRYQPYKVWLDEIKRQRYGPGPSDAAKLEAWKRWAEPAEAPLWQKGA